MKITELGRSLERKTGSIRNCIEQGTIPPALVTYTAKGSELAAGGACASKRPSAGGNIGGRQHAELILGVSRDDSKGTGERCTLAYR